MRQYKPKVQNVKKLEIYLSKIKEVKVVIKPSNK
jgi:hypothetical protein